MFVSAENNMQISCQLLAAAGGFTLDKRGRFPYIYGRKAWKGRSTCFSGVQRDAALVQGVPRRRGRWSRSRRAEPAHAALGPAVSRVKGQECGRCARIQVVPRISGGSPAGMAAEAARVSFALNQIGSGRFFAPKRSVNGNEQRASQDL